MSHLSVLITGVSGTGKTTVSAELQKRGYATIDMDSTFCRMRYRETKEWVEEEFQNHDLSWVKNVEWIYNQDAVKEVIEQQSGITFFCGSADNLEAIFPLFDRVFILHIDEQTMRHRLTHRTENNWAQTAEVQDWEVAKKEEYEQKLVKKGAAKIDAKNPVDRVVDDILNMMNQ